MIQIAIDVQKDSNETNQTLTTRSSAGVTRSNVKGSRNLQTADQGRGCSRRDAANDKNQPAGSSMNQTSQTDSAVSKSVTEGVVMFLFLALDVRYICQSQSQSHILNCEGKHQVDVISSTRLIEHCTRIVDVRVQIPSRPEIFSSFLAVARKPTSKVWLLLRPITTVANSAMNQSEFLAITCDLAGKIASTRCDWFWFCFPLVNKLAREFLANL